MNAALMFAAFASQPNFAAFDPPQEAPRSAPQLPGGATFYRSARYTQSISILDERDRIVPFLIQRMKDRRWHQPGGLEGLTGWRADKYRTLPKGGRVRAWIGNVPVLNSFNVYQYNRGIQRQYPDGTRFDEVLKNADGEVFEHRVREKHDGKWLNDIIYRNPKARPEGYEPVSLTQCASCHSEAGTGKYADGLVPGGDGVLSDPLDWSLIGADYEGQKKAEPKQAAPQALQKTACECQGRGNCVCAESQCSCANCGKGPNRVRNGRVETAPQPQMQARPQFYFRSAPACPT